MYHFFAWLVPFSFCVATGLAFQGHVRASPTESFHPYYEEVMPKEIFTVRNSTLQPKPTIKGIALQTKSGSGVTQFHTHENFLFPEYIHHAQCVCQLAFRLNAGVEVSPNANDLELDVFDLAKPTSATYHPNISGYQGRVLVKESLPGAGVAYVEYGLQPFDCSKEGLGGKLVGYEVAPKWWDRSAEVNITWSGMYALLLRRRIQRQFEPPN